MPNVMDALPYIGGAICSTPQSLAGAHYYKCRAVTLRLGEEKKKEEEEDKKLWADAQLDGRPAEHRWRPLRKFCNSIVPRHKV